MATEKKKLKRTKRFGTRYGRTIKLKVEQIEQELKKKHECPYCHYKKVKRLSMGIWQCSKCTAKFTGKAYSIKRKMVFDKKAEMLETVPEAEEVQEAPINAPTEEANPEEVQNG